jgi:hypothetical protein
VDDLPYPHTVSPTSSYSFSSVFLLPPPPSSLLPPPSPTVDGDRLLHLPAVLMPVCTFTFIFAFAFAFPYRGNRNALPFLDSS